MNNKLRWIVLGGFTVMTATTLWLQRQDGLELPPPTIASLETDSRFHLSQTARQQNLVPSNFYQANSTTAKKDSVLPRSRQAQAETLPQPTDVDDPDNPRLDDATVESVYDTGEFLDPDAEIPSQPVEGETDPLDTGPFLEVDVPPNNDSTHSISR
ncbi:MAG: hypothetical protein WCS87_16535 [Methylococcaceae bacterium]